MFSLITSASILGLMHSVQQQTMLGIDFNLHAVIAEVFRPFLAVLHQLHAVLFTDPPHLGNIGKIRGVFILPPVLDVIGFPMHRRHDDVGGRVPAERLENVFQIALESDAVKDDQVRLFGDHHVVCPAQHIAQGTEEPTCFL